MKNSLVTRMFTALARGEMPREKPARLTPSPIKSVSDVFGLCGRCQVTGEMDEIQFESGMSWRVCRCCLAVSENMVLTDYVLLDDGTVQFVEVE